MLGEAFPRTKNTLLTARGDAALSKRPYQSVTLAASLHPDLDAYDDVLLRYTNVWVQPTVSVQSLSLMGRTLLGMLQPTLKSPLPLSKSLINVYCHIVMGRWVAGCLDWVSTVIEFLPSDQAFLLIVLLSIVEAKLMNNECSLGRCTWRTQSQNPDV